MAMAMNVSEVGANNGHQPKFIDVKGVRTRYYEIGSGEAMVLLHGAGWSGATSANTWGPNLTGLGKEFHVFAPDRLGSGMTDHPKDPKDYTIQAVVAHVYDFLKAVGVDKVHVVGQSRGAYVATRLVLDHPEMAKTLVIVDTATLAPDVGDLEERRAELFSQAPAARREKHRYRLASMSFHPEHLTDEFIDTALYMDDLPGSKETKQQMKDGGNALFIESLRAQKEETLAWLEEGRLQLPTLISWGKDDGSALLEQGYLLFDRIAKKTPNVRMYIFNQAGHFHYREHVEEFNRVVTQFVRAWS
jgi:pimeloyl-ACP methyl ester carboxylesterase